MDGRHAALVFNVLDGRFPWDVEPARIEFSGRSADRKVVVGPVRTRRHIQPHGVTPCAPRLSCPLRHGNRDAGSRHRDLERRGRLRPPPLAARMFPPRHRHLRAKSADLTVRTPALRAPRPASDICTRTGRGSRHHDAERSMMTRTTASGRWAARAISRRRCCPRRPPRRGFPGGMDGRHAALVFNVLDLVGSRGTSSPPASNFPDASPTRRERPRFGVRRFGT